MKPVYSAPALLVLAVAVLAGSCSAEDPSTTGTELVPVVTPPTGGVGAGAAPGGATPGGGAGASGTTGVAVPPSTMTLPGTAGGAPAGGAQSVVVVEDKPCEKKVRTAGRTIPDFMIVLDRSASMRTTVAPNVSCVDLVAALLTPACYNVNCLSTQWMNTTACGGMMPAGVDRWTPAVSALKSLTQMFQSKVNFGLTIFPGPEQGGGPNAQCTTGVQRVPVGLNSAQAIASALDATQPGGYTPTAATLQVVLQQIQAKKTDPDTQLPPQFVLLVTDGAPNCVGQNPANDPQAHQATVAAIDALAKAGVKTYVIGYDASVDQNLAMQLTEYARHGGTNNFYAVQDGPSLVSQFAAITGVVAECSYKLDMKPADPKYVLVELDGKKVNLNEADGWVIDDKNVTLQGASCATLRDGSRQHTLAVTVECVPQVLN